MGIKWVEKIYRRLQLKAIGEISGPHFPVVDVSAKLGVSTKIFMRGSKTHLARTSENGY